MNNSRETTDVDWEGTLSPTTHSIIGLYLAAIGAISFPSNCLMLAVLRTKNFRRPANLFFISCVVSSLIQTSVGLPMTVAANIAHRWLFGEVGCLAYGFIMFVSLLNNLATYTVIGVYRYIFLFSKTRTRQHRETMIPKLVVASWLYAGFWAALPLLGWGSYGLEPAHTSCSIAWGEATSSSRSYLVAISLFVFVLPMITICVVYGKIIKRTVLQLHAMVEVKSHVFTVQVKNSDAGASARNCFTNTIQRQKSRIEVQLTKVITLNVVLFCLSCVPYGILSFLFSAGVRLPILLTAFPSLIIKTQCAFTPFIYFFLHEQYRDSTFRLFKAIRTKMRRSQ